ncbi:hypothetical protein FACS189447_05290 [Spirochaetia bacterium]|nr:hypothetical protein FACS189447_05290 [Spirochaetia bacterium]
MQTMPLESGKGYAVLSVDADTDDRKVGELLSAAGMEYQSESSEGFYINDFSGLKWLALDSYREELEDFDPRDDGYGEKLKSFFVAQGMRRFFVPLEDTGNQRSLEKTFSRVLGDIPFSLEILGNPRPLLIYFVMMGAACIAALFLSREKWLFVLNIPVFLAFSWAGVPGLILAGVLAGLRGLLREALGELFSVRSYGTLKERLLPYRINFFAAFFFLIFFGILIRINALPLIPSLAGPGSLFVLGLIARSDQKRRRSNAPHIRFMPVPIILKSAKLPVFQPSMMAFEAAAIIALAFPIFYSGPYSGSAKGEGVGDFSNLVLPEDYAEHMAFQTAFSLLPLDRKGGGEYFRYSLGEDGLIANTEAALPINQIATQEIPPYPLEKLTDFLLYSENKVIPAPGTQLKDWISVFLIMIVSFPIRFSKENQEGKKKKPDLLRDRRIAA